MNGIFKETQYRNLMLEIDANSELKELRDKKAKRSQCCFKNRLIDGFLIGACRAFYKGRLPKELSKNRSDTISSIETPKLVDRDDVIFILKVIAYGHLLNEVGKDEEKKKNIHGILLDISKCSEIAEQYFKGGWLIPENNNFYHIVVSDNPDSELLNDFDLNAWKTIISSEE